MCGCGCGCMYLSVFYVSVLISSFVPPSHTTAKNTHNCYLSADLKMNKNKNRYKDVLPYEHTRVRLGGEGERGERGERGRGGDYINASLVKGVLGHRFVCCHWE